MKYWKQNENEILKLRKIGMGQESEETCIELDWCGVERSGVK